jgi:hypothetical protein
MNKLSPHDELKIKAFVEKWSVDQLPADKATLSDLMTQARVFEKILTPSGGFPDPVLLADLAVPISRVEHALQSISDMEQKVTLKVAIKSAAPDFNLEALNRSEASLRKRLAQAVPGTVRHEQLNRRLEAILTAKDHWVGQAVEQNLKYIGPTARLKARIAARKQAKLTNEEEPFNE